MKCLLRAWRGLGNKKPARVAVSAETATLRLFLSWPSVDSSGRLYLGPDRMQHDRIGACWAAAADEAAGPGAVILLAHSELGSVQWRRQTPHVRAVRTYMATPSTLICALKYKIMPYALTVRRRPKQGSLAAPCWWQRLPLARRCLARLG